MDNYILFLPAIFNDLICSYTLKVIADENYPGSSEFSLWPNRLTEYNNVCSEIQPKLLAWMWFIIR